MPADEKRELQFEDCLTEVLEGIPEERVLSLLKETPYLCDAVFTGFRVNTASLANPIVRQRLLKRASDDRLCQDGLCALWIDSNYALWGRVGMATVDEIKGSMGELVSEFGRARVKVACVLDDRVSVNRLAARVDAVHVDEPAEPDPTPERIEPITPADDRAEAAAMDGLRRRVSELAARVSASEEAEADASRELERVRAALRAAMDEVSSLRDRLSRAENTRERVERAKASVESLKQHLEQELRQARKEISELRSGRQAPAERAPESSAPDWAPVLSSMLRRGECAAVRAFCESVKRSDPRNLPASFLLEQAYARMGLAREQSVECVAIAERLLEMGERRDAVALICRAIEADPSCAATIDRLQAAIESLDLKDDETASKVIQAVARVRSANQTAYRRLQRTLARTGRVAAPKVDREALHRDRTISLSDGVRTFHTSVRRIRSALDRNAVDEAQAVRAGLEVLRKTDPGLYGKLIRALDTEDRWLSSALTGNAGPVVVDGSNVAWHGDPRRPRLQQILDARTELRGAGHFPVWIYVDAALVHQIDDPAGLDKLIESGEIIAAESYTDADEAVLRHARRLSCPVLTNDRMLEWDPRGEVRKLRFTIDELGVTLFDRV